MSHGHPVTPSTCGSNRNRPQTAHSPTGAARGISPRQRHCPARHSSSEHSVVYGPRSGGGIGKRQGVMKWYEKQKG
eukprot:scaffold21580_cov65-Phaeocystis_antarctica.AAC.4